MNREILFRAKLKDDYFNEGWQYGLVHCTWFSGNIFKYWLTPVKKENLHTFKTVCVDPDTICQYTGLTDKNGTKIFDGDILHFGDKNYLVFWNDECFQWQMRIRKDGFSFPVYSGQDTGCPVECITLSWVAAEIPIIGTMSTEIVGNIYDNPELIEK